jgi:hypothetical protein
MATHVLLPVYLQLLPHVYLVSDKLDVDDITVCRSGTVDSVWIVGDGIDV